jgi:hypothetical protein
MARTSRKASTRAAYTLVDLSGLDKEDQKELVEDAMNGGAQYGIRVVEESINGGASAPIFGYYNAPNPDADKWAQAKKDLGLDASDVDDSEVASAAVGVIEADPRRAAALREQAAQNAAARADAIRAGEASAIAEITGEEDDEDTRRLGGTDRTGATDGHTVNTVDSTLDPNATNVDGASAEDETESGSKAKAKSKTPR